LPRYSIATPAQGDGVIGAAEVRRLADLTEKRAAALTGAS
jgi:hypothetical protein